MKKWLVAAVVALMAFGLVGGPVSASNPGTVKIDGIPFDQVPNNEPHPGCLFQLQFFGFPTGTQVSYKFAVYPPTSNTNGPGTLIVPPGVVSATLPAQGAKKLNLDTGAISLQQGLANAGVTAHPIQGFHVKLTVNTPGGKKYKVFWVECQVNPYN